MLSPVFAARGPGWPVVKAALAHYGSIFDINTIPYGFTVPVGDVSWPPATQGLKLGQAVSRIRNRGDFSQHASDLKVLGLQSREELAGTTFDLLVEALIVYQKVRQQSETLLSVPSKFRVPANSSYPMHLHGFALGPKFAAWRMTMTEEEKTRMLKKLKPGTSLPLPGPLRDRRGSEVLLSALRSYQSAFGHMNIPHGFVVPSDSAFPKSTHGFRLGHRVAHMRARGSFPDLRQEVDKIGDFPWVGTRDRELLGILDGLIEAERW